MVRSDFLEIQICLLQIVLSPIEFSKSRFVAGNIISLIQRSYRLVLISGSKIKNSKEKKYLAKQTAHATHTLAEILYKMHVSCVVGNFH